MSFATAINCIDGRTQPAVVHFVARRFRVQYVDLITEVAPILALGVGLDRRARRWIINRLDVSMSVHDSTQIAVVAHHDCAGNPVEDDVQFEQLRKAVTYLADSFSEATVMGVWVNFAWGAGEIYRREPGSTLLHRYA